MIPTQPASQLMAALNTNNFLNTLSSAVHGTPALTQTALQSLYNELLTVASHASTQQGASSNGRHKHALLLRLILSSVLWIEMQGKGKEELDLFDNCSSHLSGLLVLSVNGRASQSDGGAVVRVKRTERPNSGKPTVAEELQAYRLAMLARALPQCLQNNMRTLYHISLVGVNTDWAALATVLPSLPQLHHLHVQQCEITDDAAGGVLSALSGCGVTHLSLSGNRLTDAVIHPLRRLILSQALRREDIEWQWRLRVADRLPVRRSSKRRRSDAKANETKSDAIREQGLLSVDVSGNSITDDGMLRLIDTLADDCWLLAVLLHDNIHSERAVSSFFNMLAHNTTLLHYTIMPVPPAPPTAGFPPSSPRSPRPASPRGVLSPAASSSSVSSARFWSSVSSLSDPHFHTRSAGLAKLPSRQLLLCPRLTLNDQSAARFGHGMRGQRDVQIVAAAEPNRLLAVVDTACSAAWDKLIRQKQDDLRSAQRSDGRPASAARSHSKRPLSPPVTSVRPSSASSSSVYPSSRPSSAATHSVSANRAQPGIGDNHQPVPAASVGFRSGEPTKPLPLALLDSLFKQLESVDSVSPSTTPKPTVPHTNPQLQPHNQTASALSTQPFAAQHAPYKEQEFHGQPRQERSPNSVGEKARESEEKRESEYEEHQVAEADWRELQQWANEQQSKVVPFDRSAPRGCNTVVEDEVLDEREAHSFVRPSGQLLSLSDLLDDD